MLKTPLSKAALIAISASSLVGTLMIFITEVLKVLGVVDRLRETVRLMGGDSDSDSDSDSELDSDSDSELDSDFSESELDSDFSESELDSDFSESDFACSEEPNF